MSIVAVDGVNMSNTKSTHLRFYSSLHTRTNNAFCRNTCRPLRRCRDASVILKKSLDWVGTTEGLSNDTIPLLLRIVRFSGILIDVQRKSPKDKHRQGCNSVFSSGCDELGIKTFWQGSRSDLALKAGFRLLVD